MRNVNGAAATCGAVQSHPTTRGVFSTRALGDSLDCRRAARGANQSFLIPIRCDQNQRLRCTVFLDAPTSHSRPFWWGLVAQIWLPPPKAEFMAFFQEAKGSFLLVTR